MINNIKNCKKVIIYLIMIFYYINVNFLITIFKIQIFIVNFDVQSVLFLLFIIIIISIIN